MSGKEILKQAMALKPEEKYAIVDGLLKSLDDPDHKIDDLWTEEAMKRLELYRSGKSEGISMEDVFNNY